MFMLVDPSLFNVAKEYVGTSNKGATVVDSNNPSTVKIWTAAVTQNKRIETSGNEAGDVILEVVIQIVPYRAKQKK
jgi:cytochrome c551/c552